MEVYTWREARGKNEHGYCESTFGSVVFLGNLRQGKVGTTLGLGLKLCRLN